MVVLLDGNMNCGGGLAGALAAADEAYDVYGIHVWWISGTWGSPPLYEPEQIFRGLGTFRVSNLEDLPATYAAVAGSLPRVVSRL